MNNPCKLCPLGALQRNPVWGEGDPNSRVWIIGEAPGKDEDRKGRPFVGNSGKELDNYLLLAGIQRGDCYITNLVKCRPPENRDPKPEEVGICSYHLNKELLYADKDTIIVPVGRFAARYILGSVDLSVIHGIPQRAENGMIVVPCYHPAAGMHQTAMMTHLLNDFEAVGRTLRGIIGPEDWQDKYPIPTYDVLDKLPHTSLPPEEGVIALDTEEDGWSVQVSFKVGEGWLIHGSNNDSISLLKKWVEDEDITVVMHNAQYDLKVLHKLDIHPRKWYCTMLMANLLQDVPRGLKALAYRLAGMRMKSYSDLVTPHTQRKTLEYLATASTQIYPKPPPITALVRGQLKTKNPQSINTRLKRLFTDYSKNPELDLYSRFMSWEDREAVERRLGPLEAATIADVPFNEALHYACSDPDATLRIFPILLARIKAEGLMDSLLRDQRAVYAVMEMEETGIQLDAPYLEELGKSYSEQRTIVAREIGELAGFPVNPGSSNDVAKLLFDVLKIKPGKKTKGGTRHTTDGDFLQCSKHLHPVIPKIIKYREMQIMEKNFVDGVMDNYRRSGDGRVHPDLSMISVETGRLASYSPNLLAFPVPARSEEGGPLRDAFVAGEGRSLVSADYSQIELRVMADQGQEPTMLKVFQRGGDIHAETAADVFGIPLSEVKDKDRYAVKVVNFGIPYGMTEAKLFEDMGKEGWDIDQCKMFIQKWLRTFSGINGLMARYKNEARRFKTVRDMFGRLRRIPEVKSVHFWIREAGLRKAGNFPIQGGVASIVKEAMGQLFLLFEEIRKQGHYIYMLLQIHDDLLFEMDDDILPWAIPMIRFVMENVVQLSIPTPVDFKVGKRWGSMRSIDCV